MVSPLLGFQGWQNGQAPCQDVREFVATSLDFKLQRLAKEKDMNLYRRPKRAVHMVGRSL